MTTKKKKKINYKPFFLLMGGSFSLLLIIVFIANIITPIRKFSEKENRVLSSRPELSVSQVLSGRYEEKYETYVNDQFIFRDFWITLKANADRFLGKVEANGVLIGKKHHLIEMFTTPSKETVQTTTDAMTAFAQKHSDIEQYALVAPNAVSILSNYLPANAPVADQNAYLDSLKKTLTDGGLKFVDIRDTLKKHTDEDLYYYTDHHWTTTAAYYAFGDLGNELGIDTEKYKYKKVPVSFSFQGTLSAKSGFLSGKKEELDVYLPEDESQVPKSVVNYVDEQKKSASFYETDNLKARDKYAIFFDGNHSEIKISTAVDNSETLLIFKDSYANSLIPFLAPYYHTIIMIDPRYYYGNIEQLIESESVNKILYLYNANTFFSDTTLNITLSPDD